MKPKHQARWPWYRILLVRLLGHKQVQYDSGYRLVTYQWRSWVLVSSFGEQRG